jgi:hypothetical protein
MLQSHWWLCFNHRCAPPDVKAKSIHKFKDPREVSGWPRKSAHPAVVWGGRGELGREMSWPYMQEQVACGGEAQ